MSKRITWDWQYAVVCGGFVGKNPIRMIQGLLQGGNIGRNYTSCGKWLWSWNREYRRINLWPVSIWY